MSRRWRPGGGAKALLGPRRLAPPDQLLQPVQAQQRAGHALGLRRRRRRADLKAFLLYRTYHGSAMSPACRPPIAAAGTTRRTWSANRRLYRRSSRRDAAAGRGAGRACPMPASTCGRRVPGGDDAISPRKAARSIQCDRCCPAASCWRATPRQQPAGSRRIRMALVADAAECLEAARPHRQFTRLFHALTPTSARR